MSFGQQLYLYPLTPLEEGLTTVEIAKWREIVQNIKLISQQWKDPPVSIPILRPEPCTLLGEMVLNALDVYYTEEVWTCHFSASSSHLVGPKVNFSRLWGLIAPQLRIWGTPKR